MFLPVEEQMARIRRGAADIIPEQEFIEKLGKSRQTGKPLRVKLGLDPTAPDIHIGNAVPLHKLRTFQDLGHQAILLIGTFTAMVGDPSGQNKMRPQLTREQVENHAQTYLAQVGKIVDMDRAEIVKNGDWFSKMGFEEILKLMAQTTVARGLERDDFALRYKAGAPIGMHELLYPLMQAYDSVVIKSDVELGGTDQIFNILLGRDLQKEVGQPPQVAITNPLLEGLDGSEKMSKSKGNYIGIFEPPEEIFGKVMSVPDALMKKYFILATDLALEEVDKLLSKDANPRESKAALARSIVERYCGAEAARNAEAAFDKVFRDKELPDDIPEISISDLDMENGRIGIVKLVVRVGAATSGAEAKRLVRQGWVRTGTSASDMNPVNDINAQVEPAPGLILKVGKRRFFKLV